MVLKCGRRKRRGRPTSFIESFARSLVNIPRFPRNYSHSLEAPALCTDKITGNIHHASRGFAKNSSINLAGTIFVFEDVI